MRKYIYLFFVIIFTLISCTYGPIPIYQDSPVLKIDSYPLSLAFHVPDVDSNGWNSYQWDEQGVDTVNISMSIYLEDKGPVYIASINYEIYSNNSYITSDSYSYPIPLELTEEDTLTLDELDIIIDENHANDIDEEDDTLDMQGEGIIEYTITFYDNKGDYYTSVPFRSTFSISE